MSALYILGVRPDDIPDQPVPDDVRLTEVTEGDALDAGEDALHLEQPGILAAGEVDLGLIARDHSARVHAEASEKHLHLHARRVLRLVENDEGVGQGAAAHVGERRDLDRAAVDRLLHPVARHHVLEGMMPRDRVQKAIEDRKSTRLNSSHRTISYAGLCSKKKTRS